MREGFESANSTFASSKDAMSMCDNVMQGKVRLKEQLIKVSVKFFFFFLFLKFLKECNPFQNS